MLPWRYLYCMRVPDLYSMRTASQNDIVKPMDP